MKRPDLDGKRIKRSDSHEIWLVINGTRRLISSIQVYINLFGDVVDGIIDNVDLDEIDPGPPLNEGTCLVKSGDDGMIFLATGQKGTLRLMHILNFNSFVDFAFDMSKVVEIPKIIIDGLHKGPSIVSYNSTLSVTMLSTENH